MAFKDSDRFGYSIDLPIRGKMYTVQSPSYDVGMMLTELSAAGAHARALADAGKPVPDDLLDKIVLDDVAEQGYYEVVLGDALDQMKADGLPIEAIKLAALTTVVWVTQDREAAEDFFNSGGRPRPTRKPADRKAPATKKKTSRPTS